MTASLKSQLMQTFTNIFCGLFILLMLIADAVAGTTDAELEALEQQIEQQEQEEANQKAEAEAKQKAEEYLRAEEAKRKEEEAVKQNAEAEAKQIGQEGIAGENQIDEKLMGEIKKALLADGIDLSTLPEPQREAYIYGKRQEIIAKNETENQRNAISILNKVTSCLEVSSLSIKNAETSKDLISISPVVNLNNKCDIEIWTKFYTVILEPVSNPKDNYGRENYQWSEYVIESFRARENKNVVLLKNGINRNKHNDKYLIKLSVFAIQSDQYRAFLDKHASLPFDIIYDKEFRF